MQIGVQAHLNGIAWSSEFRTVVQRLVFNHFQPFSSTFIYFLLLSSTINHCHPHSSTRQTRPLETLIQGVSEWVSLSVTKLSAKPFQSCCHHYTLLEAALRESASLVTTPAILIGNFLPTCLLLYFSCHVSVIFLKQPIVLKAVVSCESTKVFWCLQPAVFQKPQRLCWTFDTVSTVHIAVFRSQRWSWSLGEGGQANFGQDLGSSYNGNPSLAINPIKTGLFWFS